MTASAPTAPRPGRAAAAGRPVGALWSLLLVGLLTVLPCAGSAQAVTAEAGPLLAPLTNPVGPAAGQATDHADGSDPVTPLLAQRAADGGPRHAAAPAPSWKGGARPDRTLCSAPDGSPRHDNGCSGHRYCAQESQLPNAPPQPVPAALPQLVTVGEVPHSVPAPAPAGQHLTPDLHELQIQRS